MMGLIHHTTTGWSNLFNFGNVRLGGFLTTHGETIIFVGEQIGTRGRMIALVEQVGGSIAVGGHIVRGGSGTFLFPHHLRKRRETEGESSGIEEVSRRTKVHQLILAHVASGAHESEGGLRMMGV